MKFNPSIYLFFTALLTLLTSVPVELSAATNPDPASLIFGENGHFLEGGWTDIKTKYLVESDGTRSLGTPKDMFNDSRDQGSKIVFFDNDTGDNVEAEVYWWNGSNIVDSDGNIADENNQLYGTDPLNPNEEAIKPFKDMGDAVNDNRLESQQNSSRDWFLDGAAGGYPDWFLFKRGQTHTEFEMPLFGGRSAEEPMIVAAYGPAADGRAILEPAESDPIISGDPDTPKRVLPFKGGYGYEKEWIHMHILAIEFRKAGFGFANAYSATSHGGDDTEPLTLVLEDCKFFNINGNSISGIPIKTLIYRTIASHGWSLPSHNQGYYTTGYTDIDDGTTHGYKSFTTMEETILYRNGFKEDPLTNADPIRDIYSRNIYQGGGAQMGHTYRNIISADGASGGPQMRLGGLMENSLVIEGYWYSGTSSNNFINPWFRDNGQVGTTAVVRNNVQLIHKIKTPADPGNPESQGASQPAHGYSMLDTTWNSVFEGNIISGAMVSDDLLDEAVFGFSMMDRQVTYNGITYDQKDNIIRNNIFYRTKWGLIVEGSVDQDKDVSGISNIVVEDNVFVSMEKLFLDSTNGTLTSRSQFDFRNNHVYTPYVKDVEWVHDNSIDIVESSAVVSAANAAENWLAPNRTLKLYVTEALGLDLLDWADDPYVDQDQAQERIDKNEEYDPTGMKTFMAVATNMRYGGTDIIPSSGKPSLTGDYPWDKRFTAISVVNWIREGFNLEPVGPGDKPVDRTNLSGILLLLLDS